MYERTTARLAKAAGNGFDRKFFVNLKFRLRLKISSKMPPSPSESDVIGNGN